MKIFLDANVLIAVLNKEYPVFPYAARILSLSDRKQYQIFTSPLCLAIAYYFCEKKSGKNAKKKIELLSQHLSFTSLDESCVERALENKRINDLEDGMEYFSAIDSKCSCIITEDTKDFYFSETEVMTARTFFEQHFNAARGR